MSAMPYDHPSRLWALTQAATGDIVFTVDRDLRLRYVNDAACAFVGKSAAELTGSTLEQARGPERAAIARGLLREVLATSRASTTEHEVEVDGVQRWLQATLTPLRDEAGEVVGVLGVARDISDRKQVEDATRFRTLLEAAPDAVLVVDAGGRVRIANGQAMTMFATTREQLMGTRVEDLIPPRFRSSHASLRTRYQQRPGVRPMSRRAVLPALRADGTEFQAEISLSPLREGDEEWTIAILRDQTQRTQREAESQRAQRIQALTQLAGGAAHEYNNAVTAILGYAELLLGRDDMPEHARKPLERIIRGAERVAELTRLLAAFSQSQDIELRPLELAAALPPALRRVRQIVGPDIEVDVDIAPDLPPIVGADKGIALLLGSLAENARDAMEGRGRLEIRAYRLDPWSIGQRMLVPSGPHGTGWVGLEVVDSGCGMDAETAARATEPFFSTKPVGKGDGLGLASAEGIVRQSGGRLFIESEPGHGARILICLPGAPTG